MDFDLIERLIGLVEQSRVTELVYTEGGTRVRVARADGEREVGGSAVRAPTSSPAEPRPDTFVITAGMPGTFYRSPAPGQAPFVSEGDEVDDGRTLAIVEAMKMLNPVEADRAGRIARILVENGASVGVGTPLFELALPEPA